MSDRKYKLRSRTVQEVRMDRSGLHVDPVDLLTDSPFADFVDALAGKLSDQQIRKFNQILGLNEVSELPEGA